MSMLGPFSTHLHGKIVQLRNSLNAHAAETAAPHGATVAATAARLMIRDASGRAQVADPSAALDIANRQWVLSQISASPAGTVTSVAAGTGLTGGTITGAGTIALSNTGVAAGTYNYANITVDAQGRITSASTGAPVVSVTANGGAGLTSSGGQNPQINQQAATAGQNGYMSAGYASKVDNIQWGAQVNSVTNVFGRTGNIAAAWGDYAITQINGVTVSFSGPSGGFEGALWFQV